MTHQHVGPEGTITCDYPHAEPPTDLVPRPGPHNAQAALLPNGTTDLSGCAVCGQPLTFRTRKGFTRGSDLLNASKIFLSHKKRALDLHDAA